MSFVKIDLAFHLTGDCFRQSFKCGEKEGFIRCASTTLGQTSMCNLAQPISGVHVSKYTVLLLTMYVDPPSTAYTQINNYSLSFENSPDILFETEACLTTGSSSSV